MKKSLSVLVAGAMVSSMFASVAFAATAELDTQGKYDALKALGIFEGTENGAELDKGMTREQLAKIIAKIKEFDTPAVTATSYSDVAADRWSAPFIEAVSKAKPFIMDGTAPNIFNPAGNVTVEQLATVMVRALGLQVKSDAAVKGNVSEWAKGFVAAAVEAKILPEKSDFTADADRATLVEATYAAKQAIDSQKEPAKVSVKEAKAVGVQKVQVTLDKAVDTTKATFTLKKGSATITLDTAATKWSDDKKSATLTLKDTKISAGDYTVTLGGIDAAEIATASASFKAENETVSKIEFVTSSDEIAKSPKVTLKVKPSNQYGEVASFPAGSYSFFVSANGTNPVLTKGSDGLLQLSLDTSAQTTGIGVVPVTIYHNDTRVTVTKTFKVGTEAYVAKVELAEPTYTNEKKALATTDDKATIKLTLYDQYGGVFTKESIIRNAQNQPTNAPNIQALITPYEPNFAAPVIDTTNYEKIELQLNKNVEKSGEYTVTVYAGTSSATTKVNVQSNKVANKVEFVEYAGVLAAGDKNKYLVINAYDAEGNKLSADDIVANAESGRFSISVSGATIAQAPADNNIVGTTGIVRYGEHKGKLKLASVDAPAKGVVYANVGIYTANVQNNATLSIPVADARIPSSLVVDTEPAAKAVLGADSNFKILVKDQYGEKLDDVTAGGIYNRDQFTIDVTVNDTTVSNTTYGQVVSQTKTDTINYDQIQFTYKGNEFSKFNAGFRFDTYANTKGTIEFKAVLKDNRNGSTIQSISRKIETIDNSTKLTYSVSAISDIYAYLDSKQIVDADLVGNVVTEAKKYASKMAKAITITAKDGAGNTVAFPDNRIQAVSSSDTTVVQAVYDSSNKAKVIGNKPGTATINVSVLGANGEYQTLSVNVTSKADAVAAATVTSDATKAYTAPTAAYTLMNLKVVDNYGVEYTGTSIGDYKPFLGVLYSVSDIKLGTLANATAADNAVTIDANGVVTAGANVKEFVLKATTSNGKVASTLVTQ